MRTLNAADREAVQIYEILKQAFEDLSVAHGPYSNLIGVFFHDLMIHFSGILLLRRWQTDYGDDCQFPHVDLEYANNPVPVESNDLRSKQEGGGISGLVKRTGLLDVTYGQAIVWGGRAAPITGKAVNLFARAAEGVRLYLPRRREQESFVYSVLMELCERFQISNTDVLIRNWEQYFDLHIVDSEQRLTSRRLIVGTRGILQNRILAANFLRQDKEVIALSHGEISNSVFDEPFFGYSEKTLCSVLVEYGSCVNGGIWNQPLINQPKVIYRSSTFGKTRYRETNQISPRPFNSTKVLYIPTLYSQNYVYGPFRNYSDEVYRMWQSELVKKIPEVTFKAHPKTRSLMGMEQSVRIETKTLENCLDEYDIFILDYFSTAMTLAMHSNKPIVFFDIGLRNMTEEFLVFVKERCFYTVINMTEELSGQIAHALDQYALSNCTWSNKGLGKYSLNDQVSPEARYRFTRIFL